MDFVCFIWHNSYSIFGGDIIAYLALYRKYRPTCFDEVAGQNYIVKILKNSIAKGCVSHAYLFSGPRGTGKTSLAKIIAKTINCFNLNGFTFCNECDSCVSFNKKNTFPAKVLEESGYFKSLKSPLDGKYLGECLILNAKKENGVVIVDLVDKCYL